MVLHTSFLFYVKSLTFDMIWQVNSLQIILHFNIIIARVFITRDANKIVWAFFIQTLACIVVPGLTLLALNQTLVCTSAVLCGTSSTWSQVFSHRLLFWNSNFSVRQLHQSLTNQSHTVVLRFSTP